jgi:hypothetical protein
MSKDLLARESTIERRRNFFDRACRQFGLEPSYVFKVLLEMMPESWPNELGGDQKGGRASSFLSRALSRVMCAEGKHDSEYKLCYAAAKKVITDEAAAYRDAWSDLLTAMDHCYQELPNEKRVDYAQEMLRTAREAVEDTDRRFGGEKASLLGQLDLLVSKLSHIESLVGVENSPAVEDFRRRERNREISAKAGPSKKFSQEHYDGLRRTFEENRVEWFKNRYHEKFGTEPPSDLFVPSRAAAVKNQIKMDYYHLFNQGDYVQFRSDMEALYREQTGLPAKGEGWVNQTYLSHCVEELFGEIEVLREASPSWLNGQRLDIYIPSLHLAIEYQGEQHYFPLEHWGGEQGLSDRKEMDTRKRAACLKAGITLLEWRYDEPISLEILKQRLNDIGVNIKE